MRATWSQSCERDCAADVAAGSSVGAFTTAMAACADIPWCEALGRCIADKLDELVASAARARHAYLGLPAMCIAAHACSLAQSYVEPNAKIRAADRERMRALLSAQYAALHASSADDARTACKVLVEADDCAGPPPCGVRGAADRAELRCLL